MFYAQLLLIYRTTTVAGHRIHDADVSELKYSSHHNWIGLDWSWSRSRTFWCQNKAKWSPQTKAPLIPQDSAYSACQTWITFPVTDAFKDQLSFGPKIFLSKGMMEDVRRAGIVTVTVAMGILHWWMFVLCSKWKFVCVHSCFGHSLHAILLCLYVSHALCFYLLCVADIMGGSSVNCTLKLRMRPTELSREPCQEIHLLSHTRMSSLSPSPSLSSINHPVSGKEAAQHSKQPQTQTALSLHKPLTRSQSKGLF